MARTSYNNILALPDAAQSWNFDLFFPSIPGSANVPTNLTYKCKTAVIPGSKIEAVTIDLHGASKREAGRATYEHTFQAAFMETIDITTINSFRAWRNFMRSWRDNSGSNSQAYKVNLELDLYDNAGNVVDTKILVGAFPTDITDVQLTGSESTPLDIQITFAFDYVSDALSW